MKKFYVCVSTIVIMPLICGLYGILHDQITYSISPEYFTKFKYLQFGFEPLPHGKDRLAVAMIGFLATWWTGLFIGLGFGLAGLACSNQKTMLKAIRTAILLTLVITMGTGFIGFFYGKFYLSKTDVDWWFPEDLTDKSSFIIVGTIHNFGYLGGLIGLIAGIFYIVKQRKRVIP